VKKIQNNSTRITQKLKVSYPLIMAPMFLVSNIDMVKSAIDNEIIGLIPSLNYLNSAELDSDIQYLNRYKQNKKGTFGINLIIKNNPKYEEHLEIIVKHKTPLVITSLGNPTEVIEKVHAYGGLVFCDVTNIKHAQKAQKADGFVAVGQGAGGHAGRISLQVLIPALRESFPDKIIIGAGGVANAKSFESIIALGADGASAGTVFISSKESKVSPQYKKAIFDANAENIVSTNILSGTPVTVIKTDYLDTIEKQLQSKQLDLNQGVKILRQAGIDADYRKIFVAGQAVQFIHKELKVSEIIKNILGEVKNV